MSSVHCIPSKTFYKNSTKKEFFQQLAKKKKRADREKNYKMRPLHDNRMFVDNTCFSEWRICKWFPRQQDALDYCADKDSSLCLFAYEQLNGKRCYLVTTRRQFWAKYRSTKISLRHFYEVIRLEDPCRLYFDIEFKHEFNPDVDSLSLMRTFIAYVCHCLYVEYEIVCDRNNIVDLCSSTENKFSRHLIFHWPHVLFLNNIHCGGFVREVYRCLQEHVTTAKSNKFLPALNRNKEFEMGDNFGNMELDDKKYLSKEYLNALLVNAEGDNKAFFCDMGVYTKNRNFRLYLSSKVSKNVPLKISPENTFPFRSTISNREKYLKYEMRKQVFDPDYEKFVDTLVCRDVFDVNNFLTYGGCGGAKLKPENIRSGSLCSPFIKGDNTHRSSECAMSRTVMRSDNNYRTGTKQSIFPSLEQFILSHVNKRGSKGHIRCWLYFEARRTVIYDIGDNRWCDHAKREHKSNHVYYVVDFNSNVVFQKCHDPDCRDYRSPEIQIPIGLNPFKLSNNDNDDTIQEFDISDEELDEMFKADFPWQDIDVRPSPQMSERTETLGHCQPLVNSPEQTCKQTFAGSVSNFFFGDGEKEDEDSLLDGMFEQSSRSSFELDGGQVEVHPTKDVSHEVYGTKGILPGVSESRDISFEVSESKDTSLEGNRTKGVFAKKRFSKCTEEESKVMSTDNSACFCSKVISNIQYATNTGAIFKDAVDDEMFSEKQDIEVYEEEGLLLDTSIPLFDDSFHSLESSLRENERISECDEKLDLLLEAPYEELDDEAFLQL